MNSRNRTIAIVSAAVLLVVLVLGVAMIASSGGDDDGDESNAALSTDERAPDGTASVGTGSGDEDSGDADADGGETRPVTVTGDPLVPFESPDDDPADGTDAPVLDGEGFDGGAITIGGSTEGPTMVVFLAHWCPHCNAEIPELVELNDAGAIPAELGVVGVSTAVDPSGANYPPSEWVVEKAWPWPIMADSDDFAAIGAYGGTGFPFTVLLDEDGMVVARKSGSSSADEIAEWIETNLA